MSQPARKLFELRQYQWECLGAIRQAREKGVRRQLVALPTGTGKTVIFARIKSHLKLPGRMLVLTHREELIEQAVAKLRQANPNLSVQVERAALSASDDAEVVVASVPTLGRSDMVRVGRIDPEQFSAIVVDEAHHAVAPTYMRILRHFRLFEPESDKLLVGFTATPLRGDGTPLERVFEKIVYSRPITDMITLGYLCPIVGYRIGTDVSLSGVRTHMGDFAEGSLGEAINVSPRNAAIVSACLRFAPEAKALVFCAGVAHAQALARAFVLSGISARAVWGLMPSEDRAAAIASFREGSSKVLTNCAVLTEGFDEPGIGCLVLARPTQSPLLYMQMVGRGTRPAPGKHALKVIDVADRSERFELMNLSRLFGLPAHFDLAGHSVTHVRRMMEEIGKQRPFADWSEVRTPEELKNLPRHPLLRAPRIDEEVLDHSGFAWLKLPDGSYRVPLGGGRWLGISRNLLGKYEILKHSASTGPLGEEPDLASALARADAIIERRHPEAVALLRQDCGWRSLPATSRQVAYMRHLGLAPPPRLTRGEAQLLITRALSGEHQVRAWAREPNLPSPMY